MLPLFYVANFNNRKNIIIKKRIFFFIRHKEAQRTFWGRRLLRDNIEFVSFRMIDKYRHYAQKILSIIERSVTKSIQSYSSNNNTNDNVILILTRICNMYQQQSQSIMLVNSEMNNQKVKSVVFEKKHHQKFLPQNNRHYSL